jgi:hypothetical protein
MVWLSKLANDGMVPCGVCDRVASCVIHNGDAVATSSLVRFFCADHLRLYLDSRPDYTEHLLDQMGTQGLYAFYDIKA